MFADWTWVSWSEAGLVVLSAPLMLAALVVIIRITGLRSFSKMSSFDFAVTVATGSILANVAVTSTSIAAGALATSALLLTQALVATLRRRHHSVEHLIDNEPMILMRGSAIDQEALDTCRVTRSDLIAKLREANVLQLSEVRAVVLETTGDISVLHGQVELDDELLEGVRDLSSDPTR